ncbi:redox-regulated ATPase YchF [Patescibacteria group bacterium]|nr:redox-regulated ATPase YchF [Patescibacteria group bacterium]MBU1911150.1 redox-regulated ATPase YchF [Patescibacteria group bacterium]
MALKVGIIGLPNVGKSTLFNALTKTRGANASNFPFCTIDPNIGIVEVPDERLDKITEIVKPAKVVPATVEFVDIAGLVKGAHKGEGLGNQFLGAIREMNALCHIVRFFEGNDITHVEGSVDPKRDRETIETELCLSDLQTIENRIDRIGGAARTGDKTRQKEVDVLDKLKAALDNTLFASTVELNEDDDLIRQSLSLLTSKPIIYAANVSEDQMHTLGIDEAREMLGVPEDTEVIVVSAKIEEDLQDLTPEEATEFLEDLAVTSSGLNRLINAAYFTLGYITYFTAGPKEARAWTIHKGDTAPKAAGVIHTDFERGFIRAETIGYDDFIEFGGELGAKEQGKMRSEGKSYVVKDGDVMLFKFNV